MNTQSVQLTLTELGHPLSGDRLEQFLDLITNNPFGSFDRMALHIGSAHLDYRPYDGDEVRRFSAANVRGNVNLLTGGPDEREGGMSLSLTRSDEKNFLGFVIREDYVDAGGGVSALSSYVESAVALMPDLDHGDVAAVMHYPDYYRAMGLKTVPKCFGMFLGWMHVFRPSAYGPFYSSEDLLQAPTLRVETWDNDVIMMMNYDAPFDHSTPETKARLVELTDYLRSRSRAVAVKPGK